MKFGLLIFFKFFGARLIVKINFMRVVLLENYSLWARGSSRTVERCLLLQLGGCTHVTDQSLHTLFTQEQDSQRFFSFLFLFFITSSLGLYER